MQLALSLITGGGTGQRDLLITVDDQATVADVAHALGSPAADVHPRFQRPPDRLWAAGRLLDPDRPAAGALTSGSLIALDEQSAQATWLAEPSGIVDLRVCGGPSAGTVARLGIGDSAIGSGPHCALVLADPAVPAVAATVSVALDGTVTLTGDVSLDGVRIKDSELWPPGAIAQVGDHALQLAVPEDPDAHLTPADGGGRAYNRPPRLLPPARGARLVVPTEPSKGDAIRFQLLSAILPVALGIVLWIVTKNAMSLLFCLMSPLLLLGSWVSDTRFGRRKHRSAVSQYKARKAEHELQLEAARVRDQSARREASPDPATALLIATGPRRRLWERRLDDPDTLHLRAGLADLPASIELHTGPDAPRDAAQPMPPSVHSVPVCVPLPALGVIGIAGPRERAAGLARWLLGQAAVLHTPRDLSAVVLSSVPGAATDWGWAGWLPHTAPRDGQDCLALIGTDGETVSRRVAELVAEIGRRREAAGAVGVVPAAPPANILVILDGARALRRVPGMPQVLAEGPRVGIYAICVDEDERLLPEECRTVIGWPSPGARVQFRGGGLELLGEILADAVSPAWCERLARALSPIRDVSRDSDGAGLPGSARLLTLLDLPDPDGAQVRERWDRDGRTTDIPLGYSTDGIFRLDLRKDGPHALVAGTTGAGKSELLQSMIAALAVANRPDTLNFVLIDYKGGSAFQDCARLPHTVGMVSDLDGHLTRRALESLAAELKRREEMLFGAHAKDIEDYWRAKRRDPSLPPLPRLVLVIDEFASLVEELPDFVAGLVDIARRGRSLGVHLVLATQRPAGVVSADIRSNTNLRIALRVTSAEDSQDVIDARDSASIAKSNPGRFYLRSGASSLVLAQAARIGGRRTSAGLRVPARVTEFCWQDLGRPLPAPPASASDDDAPTDLAVLVDAVCDAARAAGVPAQPSPWLPPLPETVTAAELAGPSGGTETAPVPFGLCDVPADQARVPLLLDLPTAGNLLVVGAPRSGRSTVLRTVAGSLAARTSPEDVHLYAIDCGANALLPLVGLPHCGAVAGRDQADRVGRLIDRLLAEVSRRQQLFAALGASSLVEQRAAAAPGGKLPWMVLLLDRWEGFTAAFETYDLGRLIDGAMRLFREGPATGLRVVMTSDRSGLLGQTSAVFDERIILRMADQNDWSMVGISPKDVPSSMPPGRALCPGAGGIREAQIALLDADPAGPAQVAALQAIGRDALRVHGRPVRAKRPLRVDPLPVRVTVDEVLALDPEFAAPAPPWALIGAGGDELEPLGIDLATSGPGFVVAGPPRSGRSTALLTMARSLLDAGTRVVAITPRRSALRALPGALTDSATEADVRAALPSTGPFVVIVDDAELLYDGPLEGVLGEVLLRGRDGECALVAAGSVDTLGSQYRGFVTDARRSRSGLLISPQGASAGDLFGIRLPRDLGGGPAGRGLLVTSGEVTPVQVAL